MSAGSSIVFRTALPRLVRNSKVNVLGGVSDISFKCSKRITPLKAPSAGISIGIRVEYVVLCSSTLFPLFLVFSCTSVGTGVHENWPCWVTYLISVIAIGNCEQFSIDKVINIISLYASNENTCAFSFFRRDIKFWMTVNSDIAKPITEITVVIFN